MVAPETTAIPPANEEIRLRALEMLYLRRDAVEALIRSLEAYQKARPRKAPCIPINAKRTCS